MAGVHRRNTNLDDFIGLNWSCWADTVNVLSSDAGGFNPENSKYRVNPSQTMTLRKEDMHIYGHCPANDDFFLVVCSHCDQVVKPQAFEMHCEKWHRSVIKTCGQTSCQAPRQQPIPGRPSSRASLCKSRQKDSRCRKNNASLLLHSNKSPKTLKEAVSVSSGKAHEEMAPVPPPSSSTPHPGAPPWHSPSQPPGDAPPSTPLSERPTVPTVPTLTAGQSAEPHCPQRGVRTYSRTHKSIHKNEWELNKHNNLEPEKNKLGSRELNINHSESSGSLTSIDQQPNELTTTEEGREPKQLPLKSKHNEKHVDAVDQKKTTQGNKSNFNNCIVLRSKNPSENVPPDEGNSSEVGRPPPYPFNQNHQSSDNSEEEEVEEAAELPVTPWHPKPLGLCTFGCHTLGCSVFTFDRRLHHLRFALTAMLERHANAHLWKKTPKVSSGLGSQHVTHPVRICNRSSKSTGSFCLQSTSVGQLENKSSQHDSQTTKSPYSTISASVSTFKQRNLTGRPGKALPTEGKAVKDAAQKHPLLLLSSRSQSNNRDPSLHVPNQKLLTSSDEDAGNTKKLCNLHPPQAKERVHSGLEKIPTFPLPSLSSPYRREAIPVQKEMNNRSFGRKRKGSAESLHLSSSLSRSSKFKCLSSHSISWKGEVVQDVFTWGLEKRSDH